MVLHVYFFFIQVFVTKRLSKKCVGYRSYSVSWVIVRSGVIQARKVHESWIKLVLPKYDQKRNGSVIRIQKQHELGCNRFRPVHRLHPFHGDSTSPARWPFQESRLWTYEPPTVTNTHQGQILPIYDCQVVHPKMRWATGFSRWQSCAEGCSTVFLWQWFHHLERAVGTPIVSATLHVPPGNCREISRLGSGWHLHVHTQLFLKHSLKSENGVST